VGGEGWGLCPQRKNWAGRRFGGKREHGENTVWKITPLLGEHPRGVGRAEKVKAEWPFGWTKRDKRFIRRVEADEEDQNTIPRENRRSP